MNFAQNSVDDYATARSICPQSREHRIHNGEPAAENLPAF
jgi:ABC-type transporter lipoprotein component MlaA